MSGKSSKASSNKSAPPLNTRSTFDARTGMPSPSVAQPSIEVSTPRRSPFLLAIFAIVAALLLIYLGLLFFAASALPAWLRPFASATTQPPAASASRLSFIRSTDEGKQRNLFVVSPDGTNQQQVTKDLYVQGAYWSPDGHHLILQATVEGMERVVRLAIGPDNKTTEAVQLTADIKTDSVLPSWSPDGQRVAFQSKRDSPTYQVYVMDADGNNKRRISDGKGFAGQPDWSPDGKTIVYVQGPEVTAGSIRELVVAPFEGGAPTQITTLRTSLTRPIWSPDGKTIACLQIMGQYDTRIVLMNADGTGPRTLVQNSASKNQEFSPSGKEIVYSSVSTEAGTPDFGDNVFKINIADGKSTNLTPDSGADYQPIWSPDGMQLAWSSTPAGKKEHKIVVANPDGTNVRVISQGDGDDYQPTWTTVK